LPAGIEGQGKQETQAPLSGGPTHPNGQKTVASLTVLIWDFNI
jgi:hypothetical protein